MFKISLPSPWSGEVPAPSASGQQSSLFSDPPVGEGRRLWQRFWGGDDGQKLPTGKVRGKCARAMLLALECAGKLPLHENIEDKVLDLGGLGSILSHICNGSFAHPTPHPSLVGEKEQRVGWHTAAVQEHFSSCWF